MPLSIAERYQLQDFAIECTATDVDRQKSILSCDDVLCTEVKRSTPVFGSVKHVFGDVVTVGLLNSEYDSHMHAFRILGKLHTDTTVLISKLRYPMAMNIVQSYSGTSYICPRHVLY